MAKYKANPIISDRDRQVLHFLWKHRVSTFQALRTILFPDAEDEVAYNRLRRLREGGFITTICLNGARDLVWSLDRRGSKYNPRVSTS